METPDSRTFCPIFGIPISRQGLDEAVEFSIESGKSGQGGAFYFVNVHSLTESRDHLLLRNAMLRARACFADGMPLVWVARRKGFPIKSRVCGPDLMKALLARTQDQAHGFIGGLPGRSEKVAKRAGLQEAFHLSPPVRPFSKDNVHEDLRNFEKQLGGRPWPKWVWVGLGAPKQELWIEIAARERPGVCFFGVGAAFDFLSGSKPRAPRWMQHSGLEWAFRLATEPKRLGSRYVTTNSKFIAAVLLSDELKKS